jgi:hypothetical protein
MLYSVLLIIRNVRNAWVLRTYCLFIIFQAVNVGVSFGYILNHHEQGHNHGNGIGEVNVIS